MFDFVQTIRVHSYAYLKGRIERLFGTLQSRLVSEMRIRNISTIEEANKYLPAFIEEYNGKFAVTPSSCESAYRPLAEGTDLNKIFCMVEERVVHTGNRIHIDNKTFVVTSMIYYSIRNKIVEIKSYRDGTRKFFIDNNEIQVEQLQDYKKAA